MSVDADLLDVSRETRATLQTYVDLLERWQRIKNLVGPATLGEVWTRHVADSLQLLDCAPEGVRWLDLGSGAGFPGLVLAIAGHARSGFQVDLVESNARKCAFLREATRITGAPARVHHARIEEVLPYLAPVDVVCARALAPLDQLLTWTEPLLRTGITGLFPKGREVESELTLARVRWTFDAELIPSRTDSEGRIVRITALAPPVLMSALPPTAIPDGVAPATDRPLRVIALANQKGGVGKTTTAINLGTALAATGENVLIVDLDPQGNASTGLGIDRRQRHRSTYHVLTGALPLREAVLATAVPRLSVAPSTMDLLGLELEVATAADRAHRLKRALTQLAGDGGAPFTYVLIDCPPSLNLLTINAMAASDAVLVPLQCEFFALEGLSQILRTIEQVRNSLNPRLAIQGIVLTMFDPRNNLSNQVVADVRAFMGEKVYETMIPRNVRVSEAPSYGKPVLLYDLKCAGSQAYLRLASEIIQREGRLRIAGLKVAVRR